MRHLLVLVGLLAGGCVSADGMNTKLRDATAGYNRALRWGDIDRAAEYLPATAQQTFMNRQDEIRERLVVVDYEITRLDLDKQTGIAASRAAITWHTDDTTIIKVTMVDQLWQFHEGDFVLVDERRAGGDPLALFAEVAEDPHPYLPGLERYRKTHEIGEDNKKKRRGRRKAESQTRTAGNPAKTRVEAEQDG